MNYFELFELPEQFAVDGAQLSSQFRQLQRQYHPDNVASGSERDKLLAVQKASEINDGYQTLKNPLTRAEYILSLNGIELKDEQQTMQDPEFLMQQMMLREELEDIEASTDIETLLFDFDAKVTRLDKAEVALLEQLLNEHEWLQAANSVRKLKFIAKLKNEVARVEDNLLS